MSIVELPFFSVLQVDTSNTENLKKNYVVIFKIVPDMASPNFLNSKRHISPTLPLIHNVTIN